MPYCFSRSYVKLQGHTALKIVEFDPNWAFPDCNSSLNSWMAMKCCTKLETVKERCPFVFQGHPSYFKVTRYKTSPILTQIGHYRTIGRSQLSNPSDLPCSVMDRDYHTLLLHIIRGHNILLVETPWGLRTDTTGFWWTGDWFWKSAYRKIQSSSAIDKLWTASTNIRGDKNTINHTLFPQI